ncbi:MAG: hypothetical protein ACLFUJ_04485 [Phycisphaerae bacterium]
MHDSTPDKPFSCPGHCPTCSASRDGEDPACAAGDASYSGWRLASAAAMAFVAPLALAAGAAGAVSQTMAPGTLRSGLTVLAAVVGLVLGAVAAGPVVRKLRCNKEMA